MSFNVTYAVNNKINYSSQNTLTVCEMGINEVVDLSCDLIEETNIDIENKIKIYRTRANSTRTQIQPALEDFKFSNIKWSHKEYFYGDVL